MCEYERGSLKQQLFFMLQSQLKPEPELVAIRKAQPNSTNNSWDALHEFEKKIEAKQANKKQ